MWPALPRRTSINWSRLSVVGCQARNQAIHVNLVCPKGLPIHYWRRRDIQYVWAMEDSSEREAPYAAGLVAAPRTQPSRETIHPRRSHSRGMRPGPPPGRLRVHRTPRPRHHRGRERDAPGTRSRSTASTDSRASANGTPRSSLAPDGGIQHLAMDIVTPSEPREQRNRHVVADVNEDSIIMTKRDDSTNHAPGLRPRWRDRHGARAADVQSLRAVLRRGAPAHGDARPTGDTARLRQFYIDREFDRFPTASRRRAPAARTARPRSARLARGDGRGDVDSELSDAALLRRGHDVQGRSDRASPSCPTSARSARDSPPSRRRTAV